ncbi:hypothetical protein TYRP_008908 [Tyrophagus putrescentiae]|nr:hypothetical protein TYRP_008908 [Tyrophagus putrescentiae]
MEYSTWILAVLSLGTASYLYLKHRFSFWERQGVRTQRFRWLFGNVLENFTANFYTQLTAWEKEYGQVFGSYLFMTPVLCISDPQLVKQMIVKDFGIFSNRFEVSKALHEMWNKNLFSANDEDWKRIRTITSPSFTSGKLKGMMSIMGHSTAKLCSYFEKVVANKEGGGEVDTKKVMAGFSTDVISSTSFANETDANEDPNNPFVANGRAFFAGSILRPILIILLPDFLLRLIGLNSFFPREPFEFFINMAKHIVQQRKEEEKGGTRKNDLVQLLIDARVDQKALEEMNYQKMTVGEGGEEEEEEVKEKKEVTTHSKMQKKLDDSEVISNMVFFFVAGFETTASTLSHVLFELAQNPNIQERLYDELKSSLGPFWEDSNENSEEYFEAVMNRVPYLEAVTKETLRKYPPVSSIGRVCNQEGYQLGPATLYKGQMVNIFVTAIHHNEQYYPAPLVFNPERFMPENKHQLVPYTYLPFSLGPRNCIAMRFAYQEIFLCLAAVVRRFRFQPTAETPAELKFKPGSGLLIADPFPLRVVVRKAG